MWQGENNFPLVRHLKHKLFSPMNVFALVINGSKHPIGIAEVKVLTRAFKPAPVIAVQVHQVNLVLTALRTDQEPRRAVKELASEIAVRLSPWQ